MSRMSRSWKGTQGAGLGGWVHVRDSCTHWGYIGIMEKKMETTIMENQMEKKMENEMETGIYIHYILFFGIWVSVHWQKDPAVFLGNRDSAL